MIALSLERIAAACRSLNRLPAAWRRWRRPGALALLVLLGSFRPAAAQPGKDGARTVATAGAVLNEYTALTANAAQGATTLTVANSALNANGRFGAALAAGDLLLLVQPQGAAIGAANDGSYGTVTALNNAGRYQLVEVAAVPSATTIVLGCRLFSAYATTGHAQVVRVPRHTALALGAGATVTAPAWDGRTGGVVALETTGAVTLAAGAALDATALGFRGGALDSGSDPPPNPDLGYRSPRPAFGAEKGESTAGSGPEYDSLGGRYGRGAPANGGGGGNAHNAAGGGGANAAAAGAAYTGLGNPDRGPANAYDPAWNLEAAGLATAASGGGGRGGYSYSNADLDALAVGPAAPGWAGDERQEKGGRGGRPVAVAGRAFFGGGGGAGDANDNAGTAGAAGGGLIYLVAGGGVSGGRLVADGGAVAALSQNDGAGGGGGGGSIVVSAAGPVSSDLLARGGAGGSQQAPGSTEANGPGGGGGGGYVAYTLGAPATDVSGGPNGSTAAPALAEFPPNGATRGGAGRVESTACSTPQCPAAVADVAARVGFATNPVVPNQPAAIVVTFENMGPDAAANVGRLVQLPPGLGAVGVSTAVGTGSYSNATGRVTFAPLPALASGARADATLTFTPTATGRVAVAASISTSTSEACQAGNNTAADDALVVVFPADLRTTLTGPATAAAGAGITYTATVENTSAPGPATADATLAVLVVQLPGALRTTAFPPGTAYDFDTGVATLGLGTVSRGAAALSFDFVFTLPGNDQPVAGAAAATAFEPDPNPANNSGGAAPMRVATAVLLPAGVGTCAGTTFDNLGPAAQGLYAEYYRGYFNGALSFFDPPRVPDLVRSESPLRHVADNDWGDVAGALGGSNVDPDGFSARYRGYLTIATAGSYTFSLLSDDVAYVWLGSAARSSPLVPAAAAVADPVPHGPRTVAGASVLLGAGPHPLLVLYGEDLGQNRLQLSYAGPDTGNVPVVIPGSALCNRQFSGPLAGRPAGPANGRAGFGLYPNPARQRVTLALAALPRAAAPGTVTLTDLAGRVLRRQSIAPGIQELVLDLSALPIGVYVVQVEQAGQRYAQRLAHTTE